MIRPSFLFALLLIAAAISTSFLALSARPLRAAEPASLAVVEQKPPAEVAEPIRAALQDKAIQLSSGDKPFFEFWFRKQLPLAKQPAGGTLDIDTMQEGTVLGVVRVNRERFDFREEEIPAGVYVVRLGIQPEDGNHQGVAPTRTFALLIPAKHDTKLEPVAHKDLMKAAAAINAAKHPSNLSLQGTPATDGDFPRLGELNDGEHKVVLLKLPARIGEAEETTITFALVYEGAGHI